MNKEDLISSDDRINITDDVKDFAKTNYSDLKKALSSKGFSKVTFEEADTYSKSEDHCVALY